MAKGYSKDLSVRAVALVEDGESRREAARMLGRRLDRDPLDRALHDDGQRGGITRRGPQSLAARGASSMAA